VSPHRRTAVLATALAMLTAGLTGATAPAAGAASTTAAAGVPTVEVRITHKRLVRLPDQITPGTTRFVISSPRQANLQLVKPAGGYRKGQAVRDIRAFERQNLDGLRSIETNTSLRGGIISRKNNPGIMWADLEPGTYWAFDVDAIGELTVEHLRTFRVAGAENAGSVKGQVLRAVAEDRWGPMTPQIKRKGRITFQNLSDHNHFLGIARLKPGKTVRDFRRWMRGAMQGDETPPPVYWDSGLETNVVGGGQSMTFRYQLPAGNYVMVCWWPSADHGGAPHAVLGMIRGLRVG
jgi:hypothetical protein